MLAVLLLPLLLPAASIQAALQVLVAGPHASCCRASSHPRHMLQLRNRPIATASRVPHGVRAAASTLHSTQKLDQQHSCVVGSSSITTAWPEQSSSYATDPSWHHPVEVQCPLLPACNRALHNPSASEHTWDAAGKPKTKPPASCRFPPCGTGCPASCSSPAACCAGSIPVPGPRAPAAPGAGAGACCTASRAACACDAAAACWPDGCMGSCDSCCADWNV